MSNDEIAAAIADVESRAKSNTHRLDKMEKRQDNLDKLVAAVAGVQKDLEHTQGDVAEIKGDVKAMMEGPKSTGTRPLWRLSRALSAHLLGPLWP